MSGLLCPHCGAPTGDFSRLDIQEARLTGLQMRVLDALVSGRNRFLSAEAIIDIIYADDATGGPDDAKNVVAVSICRLRRKLERLDIGIENRHSYGYRLIKLEDQAGA